MDDDENTLAYYGVNDGAEILMNEAEIDTKQRNESKERELQKRMEEQERVATSLHAMMQKNEYRACAKVTDNSSS